MPRPRLRLRRRRRAESAQPSPTPELTGTPRATPQPSATPRPRPDPHERIDGIRAWLAQVDHKLGVRSYVGAAAAVLGLAAAAVALVLTLSLKQDAATEDDVQALRDQISTVESTASAAAQKSVQSVNQRITDLEDKLDKLSARQTTSRRELQVVRDDIKELRSQVSASGSSSGAAAKAK